MNISIPVLKQEFGSRFRAIREGRHCNGILGFRAFLLGIKIIKTCLDKCLRILKSGYIYDAIRSLVFWETDQDEVSVWLKQEHLLSGSEKSTGFKEKSFQSPLTDVWSLNTLTLLSFSRIYICTSSKCLDVSIGKQKVFFCNACNI